MEALQALCFCILTEATKSPRGFSIDLIHHDSPQSPFYNPSMTPYELIKNAALRSISRSTRVSLYSNESIMIPNSGDYLMKIYIGTPPLERLAIADTASDLIWVQCSPCENCFPQDTPLFEPNKSSTFNVVSCASQPCTLLPQLQHECGHSGQCLYIYQYGDKSFTAGVLSVESISLGDSNDGNQNVTFPKSIFGCGVYNKFTFETTNKATGLVGLGAGPLSLVSQLGDEIGHKFSYCLVPFSATTNSKLKFGNEATISGNGVVSTPLILKPSTPSFYYLNLEGITVGQKMVQTGQTDGNIVIDSGTTLTYLEMGFYNEFVSSVKEVIGVEAVQEDLIPSPFDYCFKGGANTNFPDFVFHFTGADVALSHTNMFLKVDEDNMFCLAVVPATGIYIFGNLAQVNFQVEYDIEGKKVSFAPTDCTKN
ncbi:aspartic proteinase CDR1-like [Gastrolobium bilobum]|uniref:aspartic proteinase CDR1-like n=1 Tax=Gastrolobium bilobum TaxID=150636 RepID=UPI002AB2F9BD|nr:aspartic proteinase CDR1-like [Gastrolobium bilobum]